MLLKMKPDTLKNGIRCQVCKKETKHQGRQAQQKPKDIKRLDYGAAKHCVREKNYEHACAHNQSGQKKNAKVAPDRTVLVVAFRVPGLPEREQAKVDSISRFRFLCHNRLPF
jgi:hypothetical protein